MVDKFRILIVDDDPGVRESYQDILSPPSHSDPLSKGIGLYGEARREAQPSSLRSYDLTLTERGHEGIREVEKAVQQNRPFAAAFIDMKMPGINGAETTKGIWAIDPNIKIIIVTAYSRYTPDDIIRITDRDDMFYLRKPFNPEEIRQFARAITNMWCLERERELLTITLEKTNEELDELNRNLQRKVQKQAAHLIHAEKMAAIGILTSGFAHEINNPISFVIGNLSIMEKYCSRISSLVKMYQKMETCCDKGSTAELPALVDEIRNFKEKHKTDYIIEDISSLANESLAGANRVNDIVNDLVSSSPIDETELEHLNLNDILDSEIKFIRVAVPKNVDIVKDYGELPEIKCFSQKIRHVFMNILMNAIQAIEEDGFISVVTRYVENGRRAEDKRVEIIISDTGHGIPKKDITKIFDPFFSTKPPGKGTGLGLTITYDIIKVHGGKIAVKSEEKLGTSFIIDLPVEPNILYELV